MNEARIVARESKPGSGRGGTPDETPRPSHTYRRIRNRYRHAMRTTIPRSRLLSLWWAVTDE